MAQPSRWGEFRRSLLAQFGEEGGNGDQLEDPEGIAANQAGDLFVLDNGNNRVEEFTPAGHYLQTIASHGKEEDQLNGPQGITATAAGAIYVTEPNESRIQKWVPATQAVHDTKSIYYSSKEEAGVEACENRPQWAGLLCRTEPVAQPTDSSAEPKGEQLPDLPVVTVEYNMWLQPVKTTETIGNKERTKTTVYEGERPTEESIKAGAGKAMAPVKLKYSASLGALVEQSSGTGSETKTITRLLNTLGQLESYTDADGNATTYSYDQYGRPIEINDDASQLDGMEAKQHLKYEETTGQLTEIEDLGGKGTYGERGVGAFKATYGIEGELTSESYPNDMTASYAYNSIGEGTSLTYTKNNHCSGSECEWFHDTLTPSIHGEAISQSSSLANIKYSYQVPGRLAEVQETPTGEDCTARIYTSSEEGDRTSLTTRKSGGSECTASEGGTTERHTYDEANRLTDEEIEYEPLGNIKKLPAVEAGGHTLETTYYADGQAQSQSQNGITNEYQLDPENRTTLTTTHTGEAITAEVISHYPDPGSGAPSWTYNQTSKTWTRSIAAFGGLAAVEESGKQAVLQLRDLQGNIIGTASPSEAVGKPLSTERSTEYGVPTSEKPQDKYNWLGTTGLTTNLTSGSIVQDGATYVPQIGAPLQAEGIPLPPETFTSTPYVLAVVPIYVARNETWEEAYAREKPAGNVPNPGGEGTECTGMKACAAHYKKYVREGCLIKVRMEEDKKHVLAKAWAFCPGKILAVDSELQVCINIGSAEGGSPLEPGAGCDATVYGEQWPHQLYNVMTGPECKSEFSFNEVAGFKMLPTSKEGTEEAWFKCGETPAAAISNVIWFVLEQDSGAPIGGDGGDG